MPPPVTVQVNPFSKILIVKPSSLGDVVHSLPVLDAIKGTYPDSVVHWVIAKGFEGLLEGHPMINRLIVISKDQWKRPLRFWHTGREFQMLFKTLRAEGYDLVIDLQGLFRSAVITLAAGSPLRIGFSDARECSPIFYTHTTEGGGDIHAVDRYLKIAGLLGCKTEQVRFPLPNFRPSEEIHQLVNSLNRYITLIPGARWQTKRWPPKYFAELLELLVQHAVILGTVEDSEAGAFIKDRCGKRVIDLTGWTTLKDAVYILKNSLAVITNDTGPMHIAAALNRPIIALFGPTSPLRTGPYGSNNTVIVSSKVDCAPCYKKSCQNMACMNTISVHEVYSHCKNVLGL